MSLPMSPPVRLRTSRRRVRHHCGVPAAVVTLLIVAGCGSSGSSGVRLASSYADDLARLGVTRSDEVVLGASDVSFIATRAEVPPAVVEDVATGAGQNTTWSRLSNAAGRVAADEGYDAELQDMVRSGTIETACDHVLEGAPMTEMVLLGNILQAAPQPPHLQVQAAMEDTQELAYELYTSLESGEQSRASVALFCAVATL